MLVILVNLLLWVVRAARVWPEVCLITVCLGGLTMTANTTTANYFAAYRHLRQLVGSLVLLMTYRYEDYEDYDGYGSSIGTEKLNGSREVWSLLVREPSRNHRLSAADVLSLKTLNDVCEAIYDIHDTCVACETQEAYHTRRADERRRKLEDTAKRLAARFNVRVDSMEFIAACHSELERFSDYRQGMREDGLCIGYGVTYEQWSDERNASYSDTEEIHELLDWLASECPLLWAKYENSRLVAEQSALAA
jgi:hypothetical protein